MAIITVSFDIDTADSTDVQRAIELEAGVAQTTVTVAHAKAALIALLKFLTKKYRLQIAQQAVTPPSDPAVT